MVSMAVYFVVLGLAIPLWVAAARVTHLVRSFEDEKSEELRSESYHHLIDIGNLLSVELYALKLLLDGKGGATRKRSPKLAKATPDSGDLWAERLSLLAVVDRLNRLGQAVELGIFDTDEVWESNGEAILVAFSRTQHLVDAFQATNSKIFSSYSYLVDALKHASAVSQADQSRLGELS